MSNRFIWLPSLCLVLVGTARIFGNQAPVPAERAIAPGELAELHAMIKPHAGEAPWSTIPWLTDVWEARRRAAEEGKPIFAWLPAGEPLGCT
jgi:hypothetical protein